MRHPSTLYPLILAFSIISAIPVAASSQGADAGRSGGPTNDGQNCTTCHDFVPGDGGVLLLDAPRRYRAGQVVDLRVRVFDDDRDGAGFQISVEGPVGHIGTLMLADADHTRLTDFSDDYITHTSTGIADSEAGWAANGNAVEYVVRWQAPMSDAGPLRFYASGNALNNSGSWSTAHFYATTAPSHAAVAGDVDGDEDADLADYAALQRCFGASITSAAESCAGADLDDSGVVNEDDMDALAAAVTGPQATDPAAYLLADTARGGRLYDTWWKVIGVAEPVGDHPLYPQGGPRSGSTTFRCKECHGWDYLGNAGAYATGSHATGIRGVFDTALSPQAIFDLLKADPQVTANGHDMDVYGMSDADLWDVVRMVVEGVIDVDDHITGTTLRGDAVAGETQYNLSCARCHGFDGALINFGSMADPVYVGTVANGNPWEFLHKVRFGQPATPMLGFEHLFWSPGFAADVGAYSQTLPTQ